MYRFIVSISSCLAFIVELISSTRKYTFNPICSFAVINKTIYLCVKVCCTVNIKNVIMFSPKNSVVYTVKPKYSIENHPFIVGNREQWLIRTLLQCDIVCSLYGILSEQYCDLYCDSYLLRLNKRRYEFDVLTMSLRTMNTNKCSKHCAGGKKCS